ncbi:hypothetical protein V2J09_015700 [Rumex salicifolius]
MTSVQAQAAMIATSSASSSSDLAYLRRSRIRSASSICRTGLRLRRPHSVAHLFLVYPHASSISSSKPFNPIMEWQDCTVKMEVDVPASLAYKCYSDREAMPQWMPFISKVKVLYSILEDKPDLSRWFLKYKAFGQKIEFSWIARNLQINSLSHLRLSTSKSDLALSTQPIPNQKIHWRSMEGLQNRGAVRFYPKGPSSCLIELTVSYEVPQILTPVASALKPFLESLLLRGLERFTRFAKDYEPDSTPSSTN